jgi:hypothetical protein
MVVGESDYSVMDRLVELGCTGHWQSGAVAVSLSIIIAWILAYLAVRGKK